MNPTSLELSSTTNYGGTDNRSYARSATDMHLPTLNEEKSTDVEFSPPATGISSSSFPIVHEESTHTTNIMVPINSIGPLPSASSASFTHQSGRKSSALGPNERQLSILDPMSDRVSTILVWQNLTVQLDKVNEKNFFNVLDP